VAASIDFITNTIRFPNIKAHYAMMTPSGAQHSARQSSSGNVTPQTIYQFYGGTTCRLHPPPSLLIIQSSPPIFIFTRVQ
jgi:hypothetical protein